MKFADKIVALQRGGWSEYYLDYNGLKRIMAEIDEGDADAPPPGKQISLLSKKKLIDEPATSSTFLETLYREVQKITLFVIKEQGRIADDLYMCREEQSRIFLSSTMPAAEYEDYAGRVKTLHGMYNRIGADLLHLVQFIDLNWAGIDRIVKKLDKRVTSYNAYELFFSKDSRSAVMMAPISNEQSLDALCVTLQEAYVELRLLEMNLLTEAPQPPAVTEARVEQDLERGRRTSAPVSTPKRRRSPKRLPRRHRSIQGLQNMVETSAMMRPRPAGRLPPSKSSRLGLSEVPVIEDDADANGDDGGSTAGTTASSSSSSLSTEGAMLQKVQDDFIMAQIYAARRNIRQRGESVVVNMYAASSLGFVEQPGIQLLAPGQEEKLQILYRRDTALDAYKRKSQISSILNFVSSFIYMANYLIVVPTVVSYSEKLGADPALSSAIVGMTPFATIFSTFLYSYWTSYSYRIPLGFAATLNIIGNFIYAMGYPANSMTFVLIGRLLSGCGSCRPINRRYIADAFSTAERTAASATFVAVGCFGMALGPFLGSALQLTAKDSTSVYWQIENAPGFFMCGVWSTYLLFHVFFFVDPPKDESVPKASAAPPATVAVPEGEEKPLLPTKTLPEELPEKRIPIWEMTSVMVNFFIYFVEKLLMECVSSSTAIMTYYYFEWPGAWSGYYLAFLCAIIIPVNVWIAHLSKIYEDREMMMVMQAATIVGCLVILRYGEEYRLWQYLLGTLIIVVASNMVEGPNMSLLSKTIPKSWRKGFLNVGLLATEAATLGRTMGDVYLAVCGSRGIEHQLNYTFGTMTLLTAFTMWISYRHYDTLIPTEDKNL